ncbi:hypothetical protein, partial [Candidatus Phyllobacterium onerii]|uniref:hypothetical protein n=1 Tax=Candidatus Phyllobacterium onerii TaxID=3020828 RepID=UPI00232F174B
AILSAIIFNALIIVALIPLSLKGVKYRAVGAGALLRQRVRHSSLVFKAAAPDQPCSGPCVYACFCRFPQQVNQSGFHHPFAEMQGFDVETAVAAAWNDARELITLSGTVGHGVRYRHSVEVADDVALGLRTIQHEVFNWMPWTDFRRE